MLSSRTLFISDLHLQESRPDITNTLLYFLKVNQGQCDALFILGDLFEQPLVMWAFIGWGWLSVLVMIASFVDQLPKFLLAL